MANESLVRELLHELLDDANTHLSGHYQAMMQALWNVLMEPSEESGMRCEEAESAYLEALMEATRVEKMESLRLMVKGKIPVRKQREFDTLDREMQEYRTSRETRQAVTRLWNELHEEIAAYRAELDGAKLTEREILHLLSLLSGETRRKRVWTAYMRLGEQVEPKLLKLVRMRNRIAQKNGFDNYYSMKLATQELTWSVVQSSIKTLRRELDPLYQQVKHKIDKQICTEMQVKREQLQAWHYPHPFFQYAEDRIRSEPVGCWADRQSEIMVWFKGRGIDLNPILANSRLEPIAQKAAASFCLHLDRSGDIRISCQAEPTRAGWSLTLHELGHAVYEAGIDNQLPFVLRQPAGIFLSEASALLFERLAYDQDWMKHVEGAGLYIDRRPELLGCYYRNLLVRLYWTMTLVTFEQQMYENPAQSLNKLWWDLVEDIQGIARPAEWDFPYWAAKSHLSTLPVYYHHYLLGEAVAAQLQESLEKRYGTWHHPEAIKHMRETIFLPGMSKPWHEIVENASGHPYSVVALVRAIKQHVE